MVCYDRSKTCSSFTAWPTVLHPLAKKSGMVEVETPIPFQGRHTSGEVSWKTVEHAHRKNMEANQET